MEALGRGVAKRLVGLEHPTGGILFTTLAGVANKSRDKFLGAIVPGSILPTVGGSSSRQPVLQTVHELLNRKCQTSSLPVDVKLLDHWLLPFQS